MDFKWRGPRRIVTASSETKQRPGENASVLTFLQISLQGILPRGHGNSILPHARRRKNRERRTGRRTRHLLAADRTNLGGKPRTLYNLAREFKPRTIRGVCHVHNSTGMVTA